ncbi:TetR/AcrR family transcriptional regulator [Endozoicomonas montiporae]|uniref:Transcriptional regulator n=1 Tax=Endozoicomonas montiporae CL-33 TaxID=570277 RepID=A0A142B916_9GAMM|nr:TetR/AcrR family transcriptional regulator [Endozoicomonas montiporae]AMO55242.1 transcriptional regulator [Endozoicomonas montiporae CL-33]
MSSYHHGNLRQVLLMEARQQLHKSGAEKLSLRALARAVGVSQTAPYRHFSDKETLLVSLMTEGFAELDQCVASAEQSSESIDDELVHAGLAFVAFASANPELYKLMFGPLLAKKEDYPQLKEKALGSLGRLQGIISRKLQSTDQELIWQTTINATALVHGHASMSIDGMPACNRQTGEPIDLHKALKAFADGINA